MSNIDANELRHKLKIEAPDLWKQLSELADCWLAGITRDLNAGSAKHSYPKTFTDPVWGAIELYPWEVMILDTPMLQRLRGVRQLGMAHIVYPGAGHDRLQHAIGVVEAATRMIQALERNAENHRRFGLDQDVTIPKVDDLDRVSIRLAALLHDVGHGPFSHATEEAIQRTLQKDFEKVSTLLRDQFEGVTKVATGEVISVILVLSEALGKVLTHPNFEAVTQPMKLPAAIAARILGSRSNLNAGYLSGIISGPIDADKLDYMSRDCHNAGLPLGQDVTRLISKLEVVTVTPQNALNQELRKRADAASDHRFYEIGLSRAGLAAYEQMIIGRVLLYDRIYYHHKVRAAEAMLRTLIAVAEEERGSPYGLRELFSDHPDDAILALLGGAYKCEGFSSGGTRSKTLATDLIHRRIFHRAYAFAARFIGGLEGLPKEEQAETKHYIWSRILRTMTQWDEKVTLEQAIYDKAIELAREIEDLRRFGEGLLKEHVLVDLPLNRAVFRGGDILIRADHGHVESPNLFFDPERWSLAYENQKHCGFVFTPQHHVPLVALAARILFFEKFGIFMGRDADRAAKTSDVIKPEWIAAALDKGCCGVECAEVMQEKRPRLVLFSPSDFQLPDPWKLEDPELLKRLSESLNEALPMGVPATTHKNVITSIGHLCNFVDMLEKGGDWDTLTDLPERDLQIKLRDHLRSREVPVMEGSEVAGGETDLILPGGIVVENKVRGRTLNPFEVGDHYKWQERRYSLAISSRVGFVVLGYQPTNEAANLPLPNRVQVVRTPDCPEPRAQIRVVIPWGRTRPSSALAPK